MPREAFRIDLDDLPSGEHVVLVRAADDAGNLGSGRVSVRVP
jgi:hypothetical protein